MFIPKLIVCLREGYSWRQFRTDAASGAVVSLVALPLAMAFSIASGLPPERGLFTAIVAGFLISALGGSRVQIGGPTGAFVVVVADIVSRFGYSGLALATAMAGVILILMGITRLGELVKYIPYPVTTGFTSGIAVVIFSSQMRDAFGLQWAGPASPHALSQWKACLDAITTVNPWVVAMTAVCLGALLFWPKRWQKIPSPAVVLALGALAVSLFNLPVETIGSRFGQIPRHLPDLAWPSWGWHEMRLLIPSATTIALLGAIESLLSAVVADGMIGGRHKSSTELIAQGVANLASPFFGGMPATGAIARTATNVRNGGRTPVAGMVHSISLLLILLVAAPLAAKVPLAALAAILIVVSFHMADLPSMRFILKGPRSDQVVLLTTFALTVLVDLTVAVEVGVVLSALLFMRAIADLTHVRSLTREAAGQDALAERPRSLNQVPPGVDVYSVHGSFFFGAAHKILEIGRRLHSPPKAIVLDVSAVLHIDASGLHVIDQIWKECRARGIRLVLAGLHSQPLAVVGQTDLPERMGAENLASDLPSALARLR